jgi:hypothetical protein
MRKSVSQISGSVKRPALNDSEREFVTNVERELLKCAVLQLLRQCVGHCRWKNVGQRLWFCAAVAAAAP